MNKKKSNPKKRVNKKINKNVNKKEKKVKQERPENTKITPLPIKSIKQKSLVVGMFVFFFIFILLIFRLGFLQFIKGPELKESANRQQTANRIISAKRGNIYDSTGKLLAASAQVDTVSISPSKIKSENKEILAKAFSEIFELDYDSVLEKVNSQRSTETIIRKIEKEKIDSLKEWMKENKIYSGINIDEDVKRYYPYGNLASNLIGFCDIDNNGQEGLELRWNSVLSGTSGKIISLENAHSQLIPDINESYIPAENGSDITLTIDANIQSIAEKYLKQACIENDCRNGGNVIIMNPSNGDILAMATYPDYDLNSPRIPLNKSLEEWNKLPETDQLNALYKIWRNRAISDIYEPGSTFKIITAATGLEEDIVEPDIAGTFYCRGREVINSKVTINCWNVYGTHGSQTLRKALMNSCNPAFMQLGKKIGAPTLYKYYKAFGLFDKTGIATSGESNSVFWDLDKVGSVELATMSFGQRFGITPIQMITAVSSVANNGILVKPRIVKEIKNTDNSSVTTIEPVNVRQVISKETADKMLDMLESVVTDGTGHYGQVKGYSVAGKTGTTEPIYGDKSTYYVSSFVGISPVRNPEVVVLLTLYDARGRNGHQGGSIAAPVVGQILSEVLPYLGVPTDDLSSSNTSTVETKALPDVRNKTIAEAKKILEAAGFICKISTNDTSLIVTDQVPKPGTALINGASVNLYSSKSEARVSQEVPNLRGMSYAQARNALKAKNLNIHVTGSGVVLSQNPMAGTSVEEGTVISVTLQSNIGDAH